MEPDECGEDNHARGREQNPEDRFQSSFRYQTLARSFLFVHPDAFGQNDHRTDQNAYPPRFPFPVFSCRSYLSIPPLTMRSFVRFSFSSSHFTYSGPVRNASLSPKSEVYFFHSGVSDTFFITPI